MKNITFAIASILASFLVSCMTPGSGTTNSAISAPDLPGKSYLIAVSPFSNLTGDAAQDYFGFQISEYVSSALAGFPGIKVVERQQLSRILDEQELQLSGITDENSAVEVGAILNAQQMIVGSYVKHSAGYTLNGRLVDVATGKVMSSASSDIPDSGRIQASLKAFLFSLLSGVPEYKLTIPALARIETVTARDEGTQADYAKALSALFEKNDEAAAKYLKSVLSESNLSYSVFSGAKTAYFEMVNRMEGETFYARMLEKQIARNETLVSQAEPLSLYRATVKLLYERTMAAIKADSFILSVDRKEDVVIGDVSAMVTLPKGIGIKLNPAAVTGIRTLFSEQDIAVLGNGGLEFRKAPPSGALLSRLALSGLFTLSLGAEIGYSMDFIDSKGNLIYRLDSEPLKTFVLDEFRLSFGDDSTGAYKEAFPVDGFRLRNDGTVEIQAREVKRLSGIRVVLNQDSFRKTGTFPMENDALWKSLILHAYRKQYTRIATDDDPCPAIKDVVVTDALFATDDGELGLIPVLSSEETYAAFAQLTGIVYFGDSASATVEGEWTAGTSSRANKAQTGAFSPGTVLYFPMPGDASMQQGGPLTFTASTGGGRKNHDVRMTVGRAWPARNPRGSGSKSSEPAYSNVSAVFLENGRLYTSGGACLDTKDGRVIWDATRTGGKQTLRIDGESVTVAFGRVFITGNGTFCLDAGTGEILWKSDIRAIRGSRIVADATRIVMENSGNNGIVCLDAIRGTLLWNSDENGMASLKGDTVFVQSGSYVYLLDGKTGQLKKRVESVEAVDLDANRVYFYSGSYYSRQPKLMAWDFVSDTTVWARKIAGDLEALTNGRLYFLTPSSFGSMKLNSIDAATGKSLWEQKLTGHVYRHEYGISHINNGKIYFNDGSIRSEKDGRSLFVEDLEIPLRAFMQAGGSGYGLTLEQAVDFRGYRVGKGAIYSPLNGYAFLRFSENYAGDPVVTEDGFLITILGENIWVLDLSVVFDRE